MTGPGTTSSGPSARPGEQGWQLLYLLAGVGALLFVLLLATALVLDFIAPPPVHGGEATLLFIAANKPGHVTEQILWILPNILPVLAFTALFVALLTVQKSLALTALVFAGLPWALLLAVPVSSRGSLNLVYLSDRYVAAATDEERQVYATAAEAIIAENNTPAIVGALSAVGILLAGAAMLKGRREVFPHFLGWLGIATGVLVSCPKSCGMRCRNSTGATASSSGRGSPQPESRWSGCPGQLPSTGRPEDQGLWSLIHRPLLWDGG